MEGNLEALDTQAGSTDPGMDEAKVNEAAAKEIAEANAKAEVKVEEPSKTEVTKPDVADTAKSEQKTDPLKPKVEVQPAFDAEKSFSELNKQLAETRKWATQQAQQRAALEKEIAAIKAAQKPVLEKVAKDSELNDLQQLQRALQAQDPQALNAILAKREQAIQAKLQQEYSQQLEEVRAQAEEARMESKALKYDREVERRRADSKTFPNFTDLEPTMKKLVEDKVVVWNEEEQSIGEVIEHLYNLAKSQHSEEAIKLAEKSGKDKAEAALADEAKAAVATGGKGVSTTPADLHSMPLDKLEQLVIQLHGVADRD